MPTPKLSLPFDELDTKPPLNPQPTISDNIEQVLALLSGYDGSQRKLLKCSPVGVLYVAQPVVKGVINILADQASYNWQGEGISTTEVLIIAVPTNSSRVWVNVGAAAAPDTGYPLDSGDWLRWSINNLRSLHIHIVGNGEKVAVAYTI